MADSAPDNAIFSAEDIPKIVKLFKEADADGGGGLDLEEFCEVVHKFLKVKSTDETVALHMKIDINCDGTVDIGELLEYLMTKNEAVDHRYKPFPNPPKTINVDCNKAITRILFRCFDNEAQRNMDPVVDPIRPYRAGEYLSITSNGIMNFWTDTFEYKYTVQIGKTETEIPFAHKKKINVSDMVHLPELRELAISTSEREIFFYTCDEFPKNFKVKYALMIEDRVTAMNYWSDGTKALFSFGDIKGFLYVFTSYNARTNGLFCHECYEDISLQNYPTIYLNNVLQTNNKHFLNIKIGVFNDVCTQIRYIPQLKSYAVCGMSSKTMVLTALSEPPRRGVTKTVFESRRNKEFFTCVEYSPVNESLLTGGTDGLLRIWFPHNTMSCQMVLEGHVKPITHLVFNPKDGIFVSLSMDKNVRVWAEDGWSCLQSFQVENIGQAQLSSMCFNALNNELILANSDIAAVLGKGTDVFKDRLKTHHEPMCCALYHSIFKQVVSVCQNSVVKVWDILTGQAVMEFKVTSEKQVGLTAMTFDSPQRRLITVSQDGKVRLWNFNSGAELAVHPVTVQKQVTGIICLEDRLYVSGRNSRIIYDLDLEESDNKCLEHELLSDISSMDVQETTLVAASSDGNIVIFETESAMALYWLNASTSPQTHRIYNGAGGLVRRVSVVDEHTRNNSTNKLTATMLMPNISPLILCLKTREANAKIATLLTSADGDISAWSVDRNGGLLCQFRAVTGEGSVITCMSTNDNGDILLAGDSEGRIYLWDIREFGFKNMVEKGPFKHINGWHVSVCPPPLLRSWQSHNKAIVSVRCDPDCKKVITAGLDCNVKLWTNTGCYVGTFRKDEWDPDKLPSLDQEQDLRPSTTETGDTQMPVPNSKSPSRPTSPRPVSKHSPFIDKRFQDPTSLMALERFLNLTRKEDIEELKRIAEIQALYDQNEKNVTDMIREKHMRQRGKAYIQKPQKVEVPKGHEDKSTQNLKKDMKSRDSVNAANHSPHMQQTNTVKKNKHKPCPTQTPPIRGSSDTETCSPQTESSSLKQVRPKSGHVSKIQQRDTLEGSSLKQCPPNSLPGKKESNLTLKHVLSPHTPDKDMDKSTLRTQLKPQPPQISRTTGCNDATKMLLNIQQSVNTAKSGSDYTPKDLKLPPISGKAQLMHLQPEIEPQPDQPRLTKVCSDAAQRLLSIRRLVNTPKPRSDYTSKGLQLPPISGKDQLTHLQTESKPQPSQARLPTGCNDATKTLMNIQLPVNTTKHGCDTTLKNLKLPPISDKDKLTHLQTELKPQPALSRLTTGYNDAPKGLLNIRRPVNTTKHGCDNTLKNLQLRPTSDKHQLKHHQSQLKPCPPQTPPTTGHTNVRNSVARLHQVRH